MKHEQPKDFSDARIMLLAVFPRGNGPTDAQRMKNHEANTVIARLDDGKKVFFKNINDRSLDPQGRLVGLANDMVHPSAQGYEIWCAAVADTRKGWAR